MNKIIKLLDKVKEWVEKNIEPADAALFFFIVCVILFLSFSN